MKLGHHQLQRWYFFLRVNVNRDSTAIISDRDTFIIMDDDLNLITIFCQG